MKLIAKGNTAEILEKNENLIYKLFNDGYPKIYIEHEFDNAKTVFQLGIKTPRAYGLICVEGRDGIVYDRVIGETLSSKMQSANEEELTVWIDRFVGIHKELLSHHSNSVMDYKDFLKMFADDSAEVITQIDALEDGDCLLHGDFHPANIMVNTDNQLILIDMMNVCKGPVIYDVARTYFLLEYNKNLQDQYLELMGYELKDIVPYLEVILLIRENEMKR